VSVTILIPRSLRRFQALRKIYPQSFLRLLLYRVLAWATISPAPFFLRRGGHIGALVHHFAKLLGEGAMVLCGSRPVLAIISAASKPRMSHLCPCSKPDHSNAGTTRPRSLLPKAQSATEQSFDEPLESYWNFHQLSTQALHNAVNQATADHSLSNCRAGWPSRAILKEVINGHSEVVVGFINPPSRVTIPCRSASGSWRRPHQAAFAIDQTRHGETRRAIHPDLSIPIDGHERNVGSTNS